MEQHAVPQDITGFKFKLVGDMTLVQFGELAGGMVMAYIAYSIPTYAIIKYPIALLFALLGVGLAFVPIEERPMHVWIFNFFKAIYRPTYYIWKRNNTDFLQTPPSVSTSQIKNFSSVSPASVPMTGNTPVQNSPSVTPPPAVAVVSQQPLTSNPIAPVASAAPAPDLKSKVENTAPSSSRTLSVEELMKKREQLTKDSLAQQPAPQSAPPNAPPPMTIEELVKRRDDMNSTRDQKDAVSLLEAETKVNALTEQNKELLRQIDEIKNKLYQPSGQDVGELTKDLDSLMEKKNVLASEIATVRDELTGARVAPLTTAAYQEPPVTVRKFTKTPPAATEKQAIVSLTSIPNVVNGLVLDENDKPLDGAILIIKDGSNNSIRALRTNKVGQFIASTPLSNGNYLIEVEKANHLFDTWQLTLSGELLEPLEIRAKSPVS